LANLPQRIPGISSDKAIDETIPHNVKPVNAKSEFFYTVTERTKLGAEEGRPEFIGGEFWGQDFAKLLSQISHSEQIRMTFPNPKYHKATITNSKSQCLSATIKQHLIIIQRSS
jgi:hypothetical protein